MKNCKLGSIIVLGLILASLPYQQANANGMTGKTITSDNEVVTEAIKLDNATAKRGEATVGVKVISKSGVQLKGESIKVAAVGGDLKGIDIFNSGLKVLAGTVIELTGRDGNLTGINNKGGAGQQVVEVGENVKLTVTSKDDNGNQSMSSGIYNHDGGKLEMGANAEIKMQKESTKQCNEASSFLGVNNDQTRAGEIKLGENTRVETTVQFDGVGDRLRIGGISNKSGTLTMGDKACVISSASLGTLDTNANVLVYGIANTSDGVASSITLEGGFNINCVVQDTIVAGDQLKGVNALDNYGALATINATAVGKEKIINGNIANAEGAKTNLVLDTATSYFRGQSIVEGNNSEFNLTLANGATWFTGEHSKVTNLTLKQGGIINQTTAGSGYQTLTIDNLSGEQGIIKLDTDLAHQQGDKVNITNATSGTHYITVVDSILETGKPVQGELLLVTDKSKNLTFEGQDLFNGGLWVTTPELIGKVEKDEKNWYLSSISKKVTGSVTSLQNITESVYGAWVKNDTMRQRLGELHQGDTEQGLWTRIYGGKLAGNGADSTYTTYQIGYDLSDHKTSKDWKLGAAFEYSKGSSDYLAGSGDNSVGAVTLYGTRQTGQGENIDLTLKHGEIKGDIKTYGFGQDSADYKTRGTAFSVEYNKRMNKANGSFVEPQAQLTVGSINSHDFTTAAGTKVANDSMSSAVARLGFLVGKATKQGDYYLRASVLHEFAGKGQVQMRSANNEFFSQDVDYSDTWFEVGLGTNVQLSKANNLYFDVERSFGAKINKQWQLNAGLRWQF
ncbi:MAG: autotransporter outer membrane beta-barrel domain-containing protein [Acidaminococcaceae bacterium]